MAPPAKKTPKGTYIHLRCAIKCAILHEITKLTSPGGSKKPSAKANQAAKATLKGVSAPL
jgi:hypothetical protein